MGNHHFLWQCELCKLLTSTSLHLRSGSFDYLGPRIDGFVLSSIAPSPNKGPRETDSGRDQSRLQDFSGWLQGHVVNENKWVRIKKCLIKTRVCQEYAQKLSALPSDVLLEMLIPAESGCCMPPSNCGYRFKNATFWDAPKSGLDSKGDECLSWKNGQENLCYNCETCKAGYLQEVRNVWKALNIFNTCFIIYLTLILAFGFLCLPIDQSRRL
ncbi:hypothetical protein OIU84_022380 [Salix udensis]|uniref:Uncharacterized protein n=1 Tax=Salix udensis TaxID=889485 RepID=A0AAD6PFN4_9ROSI|nr:hypothetical protein OIU84_022380 [Salix udensis]